jgi:hypothetical protein
LKERDVASLRRIRAKKDVTDALVDDRLSLREAAAKFRQIDDEERADAGNLAPTTAGDEAVLQNVMNWATVAATGRPNEAAVRARLNGERDAILHAAPNGL